MTEVNYILTTMTDRSLIIIDELCRSTSVEEGTAIAMKICEELARSGAYTYVTTHFALLTKLADLFFNIKIWQMQTIPSGDPNNPRTMKLDYKFNLMPGPTTLRGYGIYMVRNIWPAEVLKHVDELQAQLTTKSNDPKFPTLDKRVRLKYDLECKLKKLKLQNKFTVANVNKYMNEFNSEMEKIGETSYNSQIAFADLDNTMNENAAMDHSIFDASQNMACVNPESTNSQIYLDNFGMEETDDVNCNAISEPSFYSEQHDGPDVLSPVTAHESLQTLITSPSKGKQRMQEIFTPNTDFDTSQTTSLYHSIASDSNMGALIPEVNLSYASSQCSLNLTKDALNPDSGSQDDNNIKDQLITNTEEICHQRNSETSLDHERSKNFFRGTQNNIETDVSFEASQLSSDALSQQLEMIREKRKNLTMPQNLPQPITEFTSGLNARNAEVESPFLSTFSRPLQSDLTKTSTPLITKIKRNARNFESSSISTRVQSKADENEAQITTPKMSFTILGNVKDVDLQSIQEDLESFVEDMQTDGDFYSDGEVSSPKIHENPDKSKHTTGKDSKLQDRKTQLSSNPFCKDTMLRFESTRTSKNIFNKQTNFNDLHIFPDVKIIEGPNNPSFEEGNEVVDDTHTIVQPVVRNPRPKENNVDDLIEAFNSLSNPTNIGKSTIDDKTLRQVKGIQKTDYNILKDNSFNIQKDNLEDLNENKDLANENNLEMMIEAFNSLSKPRKSKRCSADVNEIDNKEKNNININKDISYHAKKEINEVRDREAQQCTSRNSSKCLETSNTAKDIFAQEISTNNNNQIKIKITEGNFEEVYESARENTEEVYDTAWSNSELSYSPSALAKESLSDNDHRLTNTIFKSLSQENVYHSTQNCEQHISGQSKTAEKDKINTLKESKKIKVAVRVDNDDKQPSFKNNVKEVNATLISGSVTNEACTNKSVTATSINNDDSNPLYLGKPISSSDIQDIIDLSSTDDKTTQQCSTPKDFSVEDGTETEKCIPKNISHIINTDKNSPQKNNESAELNNLSNHDEQRPTEINIDNKQIQSTSNASSETVSINDVIGKIDEDKINLNKYKIEECREAVQKEKELVEKIRQIKHITEKTTKDKDAKSYQVKTSPSIPYLSVYSRSYSENSDKDNSSPSKGFVAKNTDTDTKKECPSKLTLDISRYRQEPEHLKIQKIQKILEHDHKQEEVTKIAHGDLNQNTDKISKKHKKHHKKKRRNLSQTSTDSTSVLTQHKIIEEKTMTSVSEASKLRNLDGDFTTSSSGARHLEETSNHDKDCKKEPEDVSQEKTFTSISDASRKRNFEQVFNGSSGDQDQSRPIDNEEAGQVSSDSIHTNNSDENQRKKLKTLTPPFREQRKPIQFTREQDVCINETSSSSKIEAAITRDQSKRKCFTRSKLTRKAIEEEFFEQDRKFYETSGSSAELAKMWEQRLKRPSVRQIQQSTCLATLRKTQEGVEVIPVSEQKKRRIPKFKDKIFSSSNNSVNMNIFSDKNAKTFDQFIKSDKKDYKFFNFNFGYGETSNQPSKNYGNMFNFQQVSAVSSEYTQNSTSMTFVRKRSEGLPTTSQQSRNNLSFLTPNANFSLTPEGFYKQNKNDINKLLSKYN